MKSPLNFQICPKIQKAPFSKISKSPLKKGGEDTMLNRSKCEFSTRRLKILGSVIENGTISPDPDRLRPLINLPPPSNLKELRRIMGLFAHYSQFIRSFSSKLHPLSQTTSFPLTSEALSAFNTLKKDI